VSPATAQLPGRLSDEQLQEALHVLAGAGSVELKLTVDESERLTAIESLDMDLLDAQIRQVVFFDTPDLALDRAGVVVRARRIQGRDDDSTVKLRPVKPDELDPELRATPGFVVEVDAMPGTYVCSASLSESVDAGGVRDAIKGERPIHKLFSKDQRAFYAANAPVGLELDQLEILGPIFVLKLKWAPESFARPMVAEAWLYPDASVLLELSTKTKPSEAFQAAVESRAFLASRGITTTGGQATKTRRALEVYAQRLAERRA
jgi:hypothetical protein